MRIAAYVQFQEQRLVLRVSRSITAQAFGRDRENRLERERDLVQEAPGFKASARRTDAFRAGSDIVRWGRIFISEEELQHCCNGFEVIWITLVLLLCGATVKLATVARSSNAAALSADNGVRRKVLFDNTGCAAKTPS